MSPKRPEFADCLASPSPRTRGLAMPILGLLLCGQLTGCFLIPTVAVSDCVCDMGQICTEGNVCQAKPDEEMPDADMKPTCIYNSECDGSVCEYNSADIMANRCLSMDMLVFVGDPSNCNNVTADGTRQNPYCTINKAIDVVTTSGSGQAIRLLADVNYGSLDSIKFTGKSLTIYGPYEPEPGVNPLSRPLNLIGTTTPAVSVRGDKTALILDGVVAKSTAAIMSGVSGAAQCTDQAILTFRRSVIRESTLLPGIYTNNCSNLTVDRTQIIKNAGAIQMIGNIGYYLIQNSLIVNNENMNSMRSTIVLGEGIGIIQFNTVANNIAASFPGGFQNNTAIIPLIIGSIVSGNTMSVIARTSQFYPEYDGYSFQDVTIDKDDKIFPRMTVNLLLGNPIFQDAANYDYRLIDDRSVNGTNSNCCIGRAARQRNTQIDLFGKPRSDKTEIGAISISFP